MNIFIFSGSNNKANSNCEFVAKRIAEKAEALGWSASLYLASSCNLLNCKGCTNCFLGNNCPIEDDFCDIKQNLLRSNAVVLISPVYAHNVSAPMKCLIDRCSYMMHLMPLAGKAGISVSVSSNNGNQIVSDYLDKIMEYWGVTILESVKLQNAIMDIEVQDSYISHIIERLRYFEKHNVLKANERHESIFKTYAQKYLSNPDSPEAKKWTLQGYSSKNSFQEILNSFQ